MQREFSKLSIDKQQKFILKNFMKHKYFSYYHYKITVLFSDLIYKRSEHIKYTIIKNNYLSDKFIKLLNNYKDNIHDLYHNPTNQFYYNKILFYKNKIDFLINNIAILHIKDDDGYILIDYLIDTINDVKNIIVKNDTVLQTYKIQK